MKHKRYLLKKCESLKGKTVIVTGATGAIGREICACCLMLGADVMMAVRNTVKAEEVKRKLAERFPDAKISIAELDVSVPKSIDDFVKNLPEGKKYFLINNAGVLSGKLQYETNFLGAMRLSEKLKKRAQKIIFQTSISYRWKSAHTDWDDPQSTKVPKSMRRYARAKRLLTLTVVAQNNGKYCLVHPGVCGTNLFPIRGASTFGRLFFHSPRTAALPAVVALSKKVPRTHVLGPRVFGIWGKPKMRKIQKSIFDEKELAHAREHLGSVN